MEAATPTVNMVKIPSAANIAAVIIIHFIYLVTSCSNPIFFNQILFKNLFPVNPVKEFVYLHHAILCHCHRLIFQRKVFLRRLPVHA